MDPGVPLVVSQVNPDDAAAHQGIIANPNCSTMQLVPVLMALRDAVGLERVVVDTYQSVSGTGSEAIAELEGQVRAHAAGEPLTPLGLPPPDRLQRAPRDRRRSSTTATPRRSGRSSSRAARSSTCPSSGCRARPSACRSSSATPRRSTSRPATRSRPIARGSCSRPSPGSSSRTIRPATSTRSRPRRPGATRSSSGGSASDPSIADGRGLALWVVSDNLRKGAATNAVEIAEMLVERGWVEGPPRCRSAVGSAV